MKIDKAEAEIIISLIVSAWDEGVIEDSAWPLLRRIVAEFPGIEVPTWLVVPPIQP